MTEALLQAGFQRVVRRVGDARNQTSGRKLAGAGGIGQCASRMNASPVRVVCGGYGIAATVNAWYVDSRISFDETRQLGSLGSHIADLKQKILTQGPLYVQVPILRVG